MTFARAWVLLFAVLPLAWAVWSGPVRRAAALVLKALSLLCVVLALASPSELPQLENAVTVLVDTSPAFRTPA